MRETFIPWGISVYPHFNLMPKEADMGSIIGTKRIIDDDGYIDLTLYKEDAQYIKEYIVYSDDEPVNTSFSVPVAKAEAQRMFYCP